LFRAVTVGLLVLLLGGCSASADKAAAERGVGEFRRSLAAERYHDIYVASSQDMQQATSEQALTVVLRGVHDRLGPVRESDQQSWRVNFDSRGNLVQLIYATQFTSGRGLEEFVFRANGGTVRLAGYHINSGDLLLALQRQAGANDESSNGAEGAPVSNETTVIRPARR